MDTAPDEETLRRAERDQRFIRWLFPQLSGSDEDRATTITMILASMHSRYTQGIQDAGWVIAKLADQRPQSKDLAVASKALKDLEAMTLAGMPTSV